MTYMGAYTLSTYPYTASGHFTMIMVRINIATSGAGLIVVAPSGSVISNHVDIFSPPYKIKYKYIFPFLYSTNLPNPDQFSSGIETQFI